MPVRQQTKHTKAARQIPPPQLHGHPEVIAIGNGKGGVGKTTTTINLAIAFKSMGYKVLVVDTDPDNAASRILLSETEIFQAAIERRTVYEWITDARPFTEVVAKSSLDIDIAPSASIPENDDGIEAYAGMRAYPSLDRFGKENLLREHIPDLSAYDIVIVDTPAGSGGPEAIQGMAFLAANIGLIAVGAEGPDVGSVHYFVDQIKRLRNLKSKRIVICRFKNQTHNQICQDDLRRYYPDLISDTVIPERKQVGQRNLGASLAVSTIPEYLQLSKEVLQLCLDQKSA